MSPLRQLRVDGELAALVNETPAAGNFHTGHSLDVRIGIIKLRVDGKRPEASTKPQSLPTRTRESAENHGRPQIAD
jgi:hypothetical protein